MSRSAERNEWKNKQRKQNLEFYLENKTKQEKAINQINKVEE